ncbi:hypothetical protein RhiirA4_448748 [Rhizophagus irregularis]|uniref:Uncharacterized protein n=1 Tax=Rhizophagus irregularis TaxID=588596 RepID=A0A2I1HCD3_9GLOM|nr:hypothetical protein RhiirA4_448748 [Rhizophagus irregularis]
MNQKRFIILFTLLIFFIIHVDGSLDCYPAGKRKKGCDKEWDGVNILEAHWLSYAPILNITTYVPDGENGPNYPEAFGHFTFGNDQVKHRFLRNPIFVNDHNCAYKSPNETNPYVSYWKYNEDVRPKPDFRQIYYTTSERKIADRRSLHSLLTGFVPNPLLTIFTHFTDTCYINYTNIKFTDLTSPTCRFTDITTTSLVLEIITIFADSDFADNLVSK